MILNIINLRSVNDNGSFLSIIVGSIKYMNDFEYHQFALSKRQKSFWLELISAQLGTRVILNIINLRLVSDKGDFCFY